MKLELKHLAPYLPYGVNIHYKGKKSTSILDTTIEPYTIKMNVISMMAVIRSDSGYKPILRPFSDMISLGCLDAIDEAADNEMNHGSWYVLKGELERCIKSNSNLNVHRMPVWVVDILFKYHFDVFGLIPKGLAIDINTLNQEL